MAKGTRFTDEFKRQIVNLYNSGRSAYKLSDEFDILLTILLILFSLIN